AKEAYSKITELEGKYTALGLAYKATTGTLKNFIVSNWILLLVLLFSAIFLYVILKNRIQYLRTNNRINRLGRETKVIEELLRETQTQYFEHGKMSESTYKIRIEKFSQLMRLVLHNSQQTFVVLKDEIKVIKKRTAMECKKFVLR
ncbi:MAG: hypothetical protein HGA72_05885, partial [Chlorobiaceae bacterium]|nr:hypothetical protein [Chlorobiaceae bacterium]